MKGKESVDHNCVVDIVVESVSMLATSVDFWKLSQSFVASAGVL